RACVDVEQRSRRDADLDVARHAGEANLAGRERLEANVAGDRLRVDGAGDRAGMHVARDALHQQVTVDPVELDVAADSLHRRVLGDLTAQPDVARGRVHLEPRELTAELGVGRRGLDRDRGAVRYACADPQ